MKTLSAIAHDGNLPPGKRLATLQELIVHPIEAGELLADYVAFKMANFPFVPDCPPEIKAQWELVFERNFWRTLALEGVDAIKKEMK